MRSLNAKDNSSTHTLTHVTENLLRREYHIFLDISFLPYLPIHFHDYAGRWDLRENLGTDQSRPDRGEMIKGFRKEELACRILRKLEHAAGQIITDRIA